MANPRFYSQYRQIYLEVCLYKLEDGNITVSLERGIQHSNVPHTAHLHCVLEMIQKNWGMGMD